MKKILVIGPALAQWSEIERISESLNFLNCQYAVDYIDPLETLTKDTKRIDFFNSWEIKIKLLLDNYDAFFGLSLGGVILQKNFNLFKQRNKSLVLFSVPSFSDAPLLKKLDSVINLIREKSVIDGINELSRFVFYPFAIPKCSILNDCDLDQAALRLSYGLQFVKETDSRLALKETSINYLHLIGQESLLVNNKNVVAFSGCQLEIVPRAGMRVLQNNLDYCIAKITEYFKKNL